MTTAILLAGGTGSRIGGEIPKQYIEVRGKPVLVYTAENFQRDAQVDAIAIVCSDLWKSTVQDYVHDYGLDKVHWIVSGGASFQESARNGVFHLKEALSPEDIAIISFAVSPFTTPDIIDDSIRVCRLHGNGISSEVSLLCTCISEDSESSDQSILRETVFGFSNPWTFRYGELLDAYEEGLRTGLLDQIEPHTTSLYLALGKRLWFSKSSGHNFKITTREDLERFEGLLLLQEQRRQKGNMHD